jgi:hypothetical protein
MVAWLVIVGALALVFAYSIDVRARERREEERRQAREEEERQRAEDTRRARTWEAMTEAERAALPLEQRVEIMEARERCPGGAAAVRPLPGGRTAARAVGPSWPLALGAVALLILSGLAFAAHKGVNLGPLSMRIDKPHERPQTSRVDEYLLALRGEPPPWARFGPDWTAFGIAAGGVVALTAAASALRKPRT